LALVELIAAVVADIPRFEGLDTITASLIVPTTVKFPEMSVFPESVFPEITVLLFTYNPPLRPPPY
jgi:hypothetical protein